MGTMLEIAALGLSLLIVSRLAINYYFKKKQAHNNQLIHDLMSSDNEES